MALYIPKNRISSTEIDGSIFKLAIVSFGRWERRVMDRREIVAAWTKYCTHYPNQSSFWESFRAIDIPHSTLILVENSFSDLPWCLAMSENLEYHIIENFGL